MFEIGRPGPNRRGCELDRVALNAAASAVSAEWHLVPLTQLGMRSVCGFSFFGDFYVLRYPKDPEGTRFCRNAITR